MPFLSAPVDNVLSEIDGLEEVTSDVVEDDSDSSSEDGEQWSYVNASPTSAATKVRRGRRMGHGRAY